MKCWSFVDVDLSLMFGFVTAATAATFLENEMLIICWCCCFCVDKGMMMCFCIYVLLIFCWQNVNFMFMPIKCRFFVDLLFNFCWWNVDFCEKFLFFVDFPFWSTVQYSRTAIVLVNWNVLRCNSLPFKCWEASIGPNYCILGHVHTYQLQWSVMSCRRLISVLNPAISLK